MADINLLAGKILKWESTLFTNNPGDLGGATKDGITFNTFSAWYKEHHLGETPLHVPTVDDLKALTIEEFTAILKEDFWDKCQGDLILDQQVANIIVDWFWGSGFAAIGDVQKLVGISPTDFFGPQTLAAVNQQDPKTFTDQIVEARINFYKTIVANHPDQAKWLQGWINRANDYSYQG